MEGVQIVGLEPRQSDLARGIVIARGAAPLDADKQRALWERLQTAGITEASEDNEDDPARQWLAAPWLPPSAEQLELQREAFLEVAAQYGLEQIWCVKIETGIDGVAWLDMVETETTGEVEIESDTELSPEVAAALAEDAEVLYAAPDAPEQTLEQPIIGDDDDGDDDDEDDDDDDEDDDEDDLDVEMESHWRNGIPPIETSVAFPIERYPEIIDDYDWESFGVAMKLGGDALPGEESVINAFFALWLSVYQDERADDFEAFQRADVVHDRKHRSALMWVERFAVPATAADQVHFLLWVMARINEILPIAWARFEAVDDAVKSRAITDDDSEDGDHSAAFVLAGNPFADRFRRNGSDAAMAWAVAQSMWSRREVAGMLVEVALEHDPDEAAPAVIAERLLRRALVLDSECDATGYLAIVLVRQHRPAEAIELARNAPSRDVRLLVVGEAAEYAPDAVEDALALLDAETIAETAAEDLSELVSTVARHAPAHLAAILAHLPNDVALVPYLYNASFALERPQGLMVLRKVLSLPEPPRDSTEARSAYVMAWNNACIHAHALHDFPLAVELADGGQRFGLENPYIYHSAACAYAGIGDTERALEQVALAIDKAYEHAEKMETDVDLVSLQKNPKFNQLFVDWRTRRADLN